MGPPTSIARDYWTKTHSHYFIIFPYSLAIARVQRAKQTTADKQRKKVCGHIHKPSEQGETSGKNKPLNSDKEIIMTTAATTKHTIKKEYYTTKSELLSSNDVY